MLPGTLQCVDLSLLSSEVCKKVYSEMVTEFMLCAGDLKGGKDSCVVSQPLSQRFEEKGRGDPNSVLGYES